ncbi:type VI secretion system TssO [Bacteroides sp. 224]|uniref:type VI secretion system TssO n=1 Tax=Bacteroides sp. 224 TaxID=2302936 RepID=UPI0013D7E7DE|nr:type VI secretion system TssO [Bacteroides sp. 224]NDV65225.1 type VI secretion system transmembrane protein TssQ [Bacteroides sp. 224]
MKAKNNKEIYKGYGWFSFYLAICVLVGVCIYFCYLQTSQIEVNRIVEKTEEYDVIYIRQADIANSIDSLYYYANLFNTNLNDAQLLNAVIRRKQETQSLMEDMDRKDVRLYWKLVNELNDFLSIKDSIRLAKQEEEMVRTDLLKCTEENRQTARKLTLGGISVN